MTQDAAPHPRILFEDVPSGFDTTGMIALVGTYDEMSSGDWQVHDSDWDLVVSFAAEPYAGRHVHVLSFGARQYPNTPVPGNVFGSYVVRHEESYARSVQVNQSLEDKELRSLLERTVVANDPGPSERLEIASLDSSDIPLVTVGKEERPWAAFIYQKHANRYIWALPVETTGHVAWLAYALKWLSITDDVRFPAEPDWRRSPEWATPEVQKHLSALETLESERSQVLNKLGAQESIVREDLDIALASSASAIQRLLTSDGDDLVDAVSHVLQELGFTVQDMDTVHTAQNGARLEDLQVSIKNDDGSQWVCLVEVKGYKRGAKANDVGQIYGRPARAYVATHGREADALWHIVNVWRDQNPSARPTAFSGENDLATLTDNGGSAIDTRDLYKAWQAISHGLTSTRSVREQLMNATGHWHWRP